MQIEPAVRRTTETLPSAQAKSPAPPRAPEPDARQQDRFETGEPKRRAFPLPNQFQVEAVLGLGAGGGAGWAAYLAGAAGGVVGVVGAVFLGLLSATLTLTNLEKLEISSGMY